MIGDEKIDLSKIVNFEIDLGTETTSITQDDGQELVSSIETKAIFSPSLELVSIVKYKESGYEYAADINSSFQLFRIDGELLLHKEFSQDDLKWPMGYGTIIDVFFTEDDYVFVKASDSTDILSTLLIYKPDGSEFAKVEDVVSLYKSPTRRYCLILKAHVDEILQVDTDSFKSVEYLGSKGVSTLLLELTTKDIYLNFSKNGEYFFVESFADNCIYSFKGDALLWSIDTHISDLFHIFLSDNGEVLSIRYTIEDGGERKQYYKIFNNTTGIIVEEGVLEKTVWQKYR